MGVWGFYFRITSAHFRTLPHIFDAGRYVTSAVFPCFRVHFRVFSCFWASFPLAEVCGNGVFSVSAAEFSRTPMLSSALCCCCCTYTSRLMLASICRNRFLLIHIIAYLHKPRSVARAASCPLDASISVRLSIHAPVAVPCAFDPHIQLILGFSFRLPIG